MILTKEQIENIGNWEPFDIDWSISRNLSSEYDNINERYGEILKHLLDNTLFSCTQTQDGGLSNYLEFVCCKKGAKGNNLPAMILLLNLCAPIATYGESNISNIHGGIGLNYPSADKLGYVNTQELYLIEEEIQNILRTNHIMILDCNDLDKDIPYGLTIKENLIEGNRLFNYLFQWID